MKNNVSIKTIADKLQISMSTVSRALHGNTRIGLKTREKVNELAKELHYVPNPGNVYLQGKQTYEIGIIVPALKEEFFVKIIDVLENELRPLGYHLHIFQSQENEDCQIRALDYFKKMRVDGILCSLASNTKRYDKFLEVEEFGIPIVFFDRTPRGISSFSVKSNTEGGALKVMEFLKNKGINKVALINGPANLDTSGDRLNGYLMGVEKFRMESSPSLIKSVALTPESVLEVVKEFVSAKCLPEAVFTFNDYIALYLMKAMKNLGLEPNKDMLIASYGNLPFISHLENPPIVSVEQFPERLGLSALEMLLKRIDSEEPMKPHFKMIDTELVIYPRG
ncbi:LacI family DNA-binding transcriptional regulator [Lacihabitans lacunae]|jgi:LacI family transcriptional regulator, repressor for deo operon, udp, cdd, tsx, nupC, and nupG|uniref:LacI family DNA-binding transcriptional regulator n=1 Tax=Lacihabitans lacunae TaxID=1028214 RepID=A0ABV7YQE6_9BACT